LEGHTDAVPIYNSRFRTNWEPSAVRSIALLELLTKFGVSKDQLSIADLPIRRPWKTTTQRKADRRIGVSTLWS
jgi:chemotaxis protein MotB